MRIAIQGCSHGELDKIYESVVESEKQTGKKVDLLICCGDFQACRNENDMKAMKVPKKHQRIASFWKFYSGQAIAPCLTIVIGGNHEASNYMWELYYGGWLAPKIYYLGSAGVVNVGGLRIGGISGIYKKFDYHKGHHEVPPLSAPEIISIFHVRSLEVMRCKSIQRPVDIFLSHDWPLGVYDFGDKDELLRRKPFFEQDIMNQDLGSPPAAEILEKIQPAYWFSGHLHVKFTALIPHDEFGKTTRFLALDKCLPKRRFLQILDIGKELCSPPVLEYDEEWLTILHATAKHFNPLSFDQKLPPHVEISDEQTTECRTKFGSLIIPENFTITAPVYKQNATQEQYLPTTNPQTRIFCNKLGIKNEAVPDGSKEPPGPHDELDITHDSDANMSLNISRDSSNSSRDSSNMSRDLSNMSRGSLDIITNDETDQPANEYKELLKDFSAPALRTPGLSRDQSSTPKCSTPLSKSGTPLSKTNTPGSKNGTPVTLRRRLTLPEPRNLAEPKNVPAKTAVSPVKPSDNSSDKIEVSSSAENPNSNDPDKHQPSAEIKTDVGTDKAVPSTSSDVTKNTNDVITKSSDITSPANVTIDEEFDLDETDDDLLSKFLLLKKKFGRDQSTALSDSLVVNTSLSDPAIKHEVVKKKEVEVEEDDRVKNKKFKMAVHNDIDM